MSAEVEQVWKELERHLGWSGAFLLVFVFSPTPRQAAVLGERVVEWANPAQLRRLVPETPAKLAELAVALDPMLRDITRGRPTGERPLLWIEAAASFGGTLGEEWRQSWQDLLARLNERRSLAQERLRGLILVAPMQAKASFAALAPDLWSIRTTTLELPAPPSKPVVLERDSVPTANAGPRPQGPVEKALEAARLAIEANEWMRAEVQVNEAQRRSDELVTPDKSPFAQRISMLHGAIARGRGALAEADEHYARAQAQGDTLEPLRERGLLALARGQSEQGLRWLEEALEIARLGARREHERELKKLLGQARARLGSIGAPANGSARRRAIRILHLSDIHFRAAREPETRAEQIRVETPRRAEVMAGEAWRRNIDALLEDGEIDLVCATGDIADWGLTEEFELATEFFERLLDQLGLGWERLFVLPGNHDIDRSIATEAWSAVRGSRDVDERSRWMAGAGHLRGVEDAAREQILQRQGAFRRWLFETLGRDELDTSNSAHGRLGFQVDVGPRLGLDTSLWIIGLDTAWLAGDDNDTGKLALTEDQILLLTTRAGEPLPGLRVAIAHHPLEELAGRHLGQRLLAKHADLYLHGHQHEPESRIVRDPDQQLLTLAAGCVFEGSRLDGHPNGLQTLAVELDGKGRPRRAELRFRSWSPRGHFWHDDSSIYEEARGGRAQIWWTKSGLAFGGISPALVASRERLRDELAAWESLGTAHRGLGEAAIALKDMYVPLRLGQGQGEVVDADALLRRYRPLLIRGGPGSGKTTWMRATALALAERGDAWPIFLSARAFGRLLENPNAGLNELLSAWVARWMGGDQHTFDAALADAQGPRPVLLFDGWDEFGPRGCALRGQLGEFCREHPRVLLIVSSRPQGSILGNGGEEPEESPAPAFETLELRRLEDTEIRAYIANYCRHVYRPEGTTVDAATEQLWSLFENNGFALELARTPMLLLMLLRVAREGTIPQRRVELYERCLRLMLEERPREREVIDVLRGTEQWRPEDTNTRWRALMGIARRMRWSLDDGTPFGVRGSVSLEEALTFIAEDQPRWSADQRSGFVGLLVEGAGVLEAHDDEDDSLAFVHRGFQEYLTARMLCSEVEGDEARRALVFDNLVDDSFWETLCLWATLVHSDDPKRLQPLLEPMLSKEAGDRGYWLLGMWLADGLCAEAIDDWLAQLGSRLHHSPDVSTFAECMEAWRTRAGTDARGRLREALEGSVSEGTWVDWLKIELIWRDFEFAEEPPLPAAGSGAGDVLRARMPQSSPSEAQIARGRAWWPASPLWRPSLDPRWIALRLWPSVRGLWGWRLQNSVDRYQSKCPILMSWMETHGEDLDRLKWVAAKMERIYAEMIAPSLAGVIRQDFLRARTRLFFQEEYPPFRQEAHYLHDLEYGMRFFVNVSMLGGMPDDRGLYTVRAALLLNEDPDPLLTLLRHACDPEGDPTALEEHAAPFDGDPLWPALARHLARRSTREDRALLEGLARNPEPVEDEQLRWGLKYWVRGDVMLADGTVVTLDDVWKEAGLDLLPLLEDLPPEQDSSSS